MSKDIIFVMTGLILFILGISFDFIPAFGIGLCLLILGFLIDLTDTGKNDEGNSDSDL